MERRRGQTTAFDLATHRPGIKYAWNASHVPGPDLVTDHHVGMHLHGGTPSKGLIGSLTAQRLLVGHGGLDLSQRKQVPLTSKITTRRASSAPLQGRSGSADGRSMRSARGQLCHASNAHGPSSANGPPAFRASDLLYGHAIRMRSASALRNSSGDGQQQEALHTARRGTVSGYITAEQRPQRDGALQNRPKSAGNSMAAPGSSVRRALASMPGRLVTGADRPVTPAISAHQRQRLSTWKLEGEPGFSVSERAHSRVHAGQLSVGNARARNRSAQGRRGPTGPAVPDARTGRQRISNAAIDGKRGSSVPVDTSADVNEADGGQLEPLGGRSSASKAGLTTNTRPGTPVGKRIAPRRSRSSPRTPPKISVVQRDSTSASNAASAQLSAAGARGSAEVPAGHQIRRQPAPDLATQSSARRLSTDVDVRPTRAMEYNSLCSSLDWESCSVEVHKGSKPVVFAPYEPGARGQPRFLGQALLAESHSFLSWLGADDDICTFLALSDPDDLGSSGDESADDVALC